MNLVSRGSVPVWEINRTPLVVPSPISHKGFSPTHHSVGAWGGSGKRVNEAPVGAEAYVSTKKKGEKPEDIINAFNATERHFGEYFDVSTHAAVIKMMMLKFGQSPESVFDPVTPASGGYAVKMKDGFELHLTQDELQRAAGASRFAGDDPGAIKDANFIFAAFVKRKQMEGPYASMSNGFDAALTKTLEGETPLRALKGMGMVGFMQHVPTDQMHSKGAVGVADTHYFGAGLVLEGRQYDHQRQAPVGRTYGYMLVGDDAADDDRSIEQGSVSVSSVPVGVKPGDIWSGFYQGAEGNCVTVSAIKAAMMKFGQNPTGIYKNISATSDGYAVTMRDGYSLSLTFDELKKAEQGSNLKGPDEALLKDANFLYAVSAKRAMLENHESRAGESFEVAMQTLNDGEHPGEAFRRLGLYAYTRPSTAKELAEGALGTLASYRHSVAVVSGSLDLYGSKLPLASSEWNNSGYRAIKLVGEVTPAVA
ncbi:hypothetical protein LRS56_05185 [Pseudomonas poae]|nr:hypothetical protein LRS56_05185 [Pseudomonas poae]